MNRQRGKIYSISLLVCVITFILGSISACSTSPSPTPTPTISQDQAIEIATSGCKTPHLVLVGEPQNIKTQLLTLEEADQLIRGEGETTNYGVPMDTRVWLVQMDGQLQLVGGPVPVPTEGGKGITATPPQPFWGTCSVILDADSGTILVIRG